MTINRRQVVGWGALGLGAAALDACSGLPWAKMPASHDADLGPLLRDLDRILAQLKMLEPDVRRFGIKPDGMHVAQGRDLCIQLIAALCLLGAYRDVPESRWEEPDIEARLAKTLPQIYSMLRRSRNYLARLTDEESAHVDERFKKDPNFTMRVMERVDEYARQLHVPIEMRTYLRTSTVQMAGHFRFEGTKEVTSKLTTKYDRLLSARVAALGMQPDVHAADAAEEKTDPLPLRLVFKTHASEANVRAAVCSLEPRIKLEGGDHPVVFDVEESRCATSATRFVTDPAPIRAAVHVEPGDGESAVTLVVYPPAGSEDAVSKAITSIAQELQNRLAIGQACSISADCGSLRCIDGRCRDPFAKPAPVQARVTSESRLGGVGESCRVRSDCEETLACSRGVCRSESDLPSSERLMITTGKVAKWGAILLIPPICAVGVLVLLQCFFMVIVAGCMYAGGD